MTPMAFGQWLRAQRIKAGLTQAEVAQGLGGMAKSRVSQWETGRNLPRFTAWTRLEALLQLKRGTIGQRLSRGVK